jgi:GcrA cell cycle regulator
MSATSPSWTPERIEDLKSLFEAGRTCSQIAREIGVTRNAVIGKLSRLGLSRPRGENGIPRPPRPREGALQRQVRILKILRARMELPAAEEPIGDGQRCSLFELSPQNCRWPIGTPGTGDFAFCGNATAEGFSYCPGHARMAYQPTARRHSASGPLQANRMAARR